MGALLFAPEAFHGPTRLELAKQAFETMRETMLARQSLFPVAFQQIQLAVSERDYSRIFGTTQFMTKVLDLLQDAGWGCSFGDGKQPEALLAALNATKATRKSNLAALGELELELRAVSGMCAALDQVAKKSENLDWLIEKKKR